MPATANSLELLPDLKIRLFAGGSAKAKTYPTESHLCIEFRDYEAKFEGLACCWS